LKAFKKLKDGKTTPDNVGDVVRAPQTIPQEAAGAAGGAAGEEIGKRLGGKSGAETGRKVGETSRQSRSALKGQSTKEKKS
jgi:hypothetical protein